MDIIKMKVPKVNLHQGCQHSRKNHFPHGGHNKKSKVQYGYLEIPTSNNPNLNQISLGLATWEFSVSL